MKLHIRNDTHGADIVDIDDKRYVWPRLSVELSTE